MTGDSNRLAGLDLGPRPWIVGHRGAPVAAPENTIDSFLVAIEQRAVMIELDLQLTRDDRLVALHDWDLLRTSGSEIVAEDATAAEIQAVDIGRYQGRVGKAPTIEEIFEALPPDYPLNLELKCRHADHRRYAAVLQRAIAGRRSLLLSGFDWNLLRIVRALLPEVAIAPLSDQPLPALLAAARELRAASVHCHCEAMTKAFVDDAWRSGLPVLVYTVDDPAVAAAQYSMGVAGIFTNVPGRQIEWKERVKSEE
jgi:glycerophosphoryl diester phosphodiesterase